jgi:EAL domain-containing protein (putative c-di-GMP-specific phosphodiesterase class I)
MSTDARDSLPTLGPPAAEDRFDAFSRALERLYMVFQPIVSWADREIVAYEALVRTHEPSLARPDLLFSAAEKLDMVIPMGRAIRRAVAKEVEKAPDTVSIFVNVHGGELADAELYAADAPLARVADRIVLEITERWSLDRFHDVRERIRVLRSLGYRVAVDDLGAGYAGLTSFAHLRPEIVKLDMSLIRGVNDDPTRQHLIRSLNNVCRDLGIRVVAEGVETREERDALIALGSDLFQGYLFSKPAPPFQHVTGGWDAPFSLDAPSGRTARGELLELRGTLFELLDRLGAGGECEVCGSSSGEIGALGRRALRSIELLLGTASMPSLKPIGVPPSLNKLARSA